MNNIPHDISNDGREIFDWAIGVSKAIAKQRKIVELKNAINASATCGACTKWMCSGDCPREIHQRNGRYKGPSMNSPICNEFQEKQWDIENREKLKKELETLLDK